MRTGAQRLDTVVELVRHLAIAEQVVLGTRASAQVLRADTPDELDDVIKEMLKTDKVTIVDVRVDQRENCFPMIPSGKAHNEMILSPDAEKFDKTLV